MTRHFLHVFFGIFIEVTLFINLYIFSGATSAFFNDTWSGVDVSNTYFGFSSIIKWFQDLGSNKALDAANEYLNISIKVVKTMSIDWLSKMVLNLIESAEKYNTAQTVGNYFEIIGRTILLLLSFAGSFMLLPFTVLGALGVATLGIVSWLFYITKSISYLFMGYYNIPKPTILPPSSESTSIMLVGLCPFRV